MSDTPVTPISERQIGTDHDRAIIAAMERIALAGEYPIDVIVDYFDPTAPIGSSLRQFSDFGLRALAEVERLTTAQRCCRGCPDCMGIGGRNQIIGQAAEIDRQAQVIAERETTIDPLPDHEPAEVSR